MKKFLHLMGGLWLEQPSAFSHRLSVLDSWLVARSALKPKTYHLIPGRELSAVGHQPSGLSNQSSALNRRLPTQYLLSPNTYKRIPLILFILVFVSCGAAMAQEHGVQTAPAAQAESKAIDLTSLGIQIGEKVPDITINNIHNYKSSTAKLSDFRGKLLILDFWATWCSPCVAMIPKMDSLQKEFGDIVQFLSVTYQKESDVLSFMRALEKKHDMRYNIPMVMDDNELRELFPHNILPHYVWILDGEVIKMTGSEALTNEDLTKTLERNNHAVKNKIDESTVPYNKMEPLLIRNNGDSNTSFTLYHSLFTGYIPGLAPAGYDMHSIERNNTVKVTFRNVSIDWFYRLAYGNGKRFINPSRIIYDVKNLGEIIWNDSLGVSYYDWKKNGHAFNYELIVPSWLESTVYEIMQQDLDRFIPDYEASLISVKRPCYVLKKISTEDKLKSKGGEEALKIDRYGCTMKNVHLNRLVEQLDSFYFQNSEMPILNETDYTDRIDLEFQGDLTNIDSINQGLRPYNLQFFEAEREIETLLIKDRK